MNTSILNELYVIILCWQEEIEHKDRVIEVYQSDRKKLAKQIEDFIEKENLLDGEH